MESVTLDVMQKKTQREEGEEEEEPTVAEGRSFTGRRFNVR